jgi:hypothetical protein
MGSGDKAAVGVYIGAAVVFGGGLGYTFYYLWFGEGSKVDRDPKGVNRDTNIDNKRQVFTGSDDSTTGGTIKRRKSIRKIKTRRNK